MKNKSKTLFKYKTRKNEHCFDSRLIVFYN